MSSCVDLTLSYLSAYLLINHDNEINVSVQDSMYGIIHVYQYKQKVENLNETL